jgi:hypothetical protein
VQNINLKLTVWMKQCDKYKGQNPSGEAQISKKYSFCMKFKVALQCSQKPTQSNVFAGEKEGGRAIEMNVHWLPVCPGAFLFRTLFFTVI